jgi:hypothetical protein
MNLEGFAQEEIEDPSCSGKFMKIIICLIIVIMKVILLNRILILI